MSPNQIARMNFWVPLLGVVATGAATAGIAYAVMGKDVSQNAKDIQELKAHETVITDIRLQNVAATAERLALKKGIARIERALKRQCAETAGG